MEKKFRLRIITVLAFLSLCISFSGYYVKAVYGNNILYSVGIGLAMIYTAILLYWLKKADQFWYGVIEILFAVLSLFFSIFTYSQTHSWNETTFDEFLKRAALIYLIVRGLGNVHDGIKDDFFLAATIKPCWTKLIDFLFAKDS